MPSCALASARCACFSKVALSPQRGAPSAYADQFVGLFVLQNGALVCAGCSFENAALACARCPFLMELPKTIIFWRVDLALWPQSGAPACAACAFVRLASAACSCLTRPPFSVSKMVLSPARRALFRNGALACAGCAFLGHHFPYILGLSSPGSFVRVTHARRFLPGCLSFDMVPSAFFFDEDCLRYILSAPDRYSWIFPCPIHRTLRLGSLFP